MNCYPHPFSGLIPYLLGDGLWFLSPAGIFFFIKRKMCCCCWLFLENHQVVKELNPDNVQHFLSGLIWIQTVWKGYKQATLINLKAAYSVTMNIFRIFLFSFQIICKSRIQLCFHNKNVQYS